MKVLSSGVLVLAVLSATKAAADTPTGHYVFDTEVTKQGKFSDHPDGLPPCSELSQGVVKRVVWKKGEGPAIEYVKSAHRVMVGRQLFDFMDDDEKQVGATHADGTVLTYVHFWRVNATNVALKLEQDALVDGEVVCGDNYWFHGTLTH